MFVLPFYGENKKKSIDKKNTFAIICFVSCWRCLFLPPPGPATVLDLNDMKITLDFLCLTFRSDSEEVAPLATAASLRTTSFCSNSSGPADANATCPTVNSLTVNRFSFLLVSLFSFLFELPSFVFFFVRVLSGPDCILFLWLHHFPQIFLFHRNASIVCRN